ncbi:MAG TPA: hypothetical protein VJI97_03235 [Candidatus Nanoarchaeia archaeon]|nr:hypothetical protein [Candidatus Nanoarchaeia archaeon]
MKSKKGAEGIIWIVIVFVLLLLFMFIYTGLWTKLFGKGTKGIGDQIDATSNDHDSDGVADFADRCPCIPGSNEYSGCTKTSTDADKAKRDCLK